MFKPLTEVVSSPPTKERMLNEPSSVTTWINLKVTDQKGNTNSTIYFLIKA